MVMGSYLHGSFDLPAFRRFFLGKAQRDLTWLDDLEVLVIKDYDMSVDESIERIASALKSSLDMDKVYRMLDMEVRK